MEGRYTLHEGAQTIAQSDKLHDLQDEAKLLDYHEMNDWWIVDHLRKKKIDRVQFWQIIKNTK